MTALILRFLYIGLFAIGGGLSAISLIQKEIVERLGWLTAETLVDILAIAEMTPGPIAVNSATFVGIRIAGIPGALIATFGCILPSCFIVSFLAFLYYKYKKVSAMQSVLGSLRPAVVALIGAAGLSILQLVAFGGGEASLSHLQWAECGIFLAAFLALRVWKKKPILVMFCCGATELIVEALRGLPSA